MTYSRKKRHKRIKGVLQNHGFDLIVGTSLWDVMLPISGLRQRAKGTSLQFEEFCNTPLHSVRVYYQIFRRVRGRKSCNPPCGRLMPFTELTADTALCA